ncbi:MAG: glutamine synthetase family protein [Woeseiaceae bacterium]|nr:glutamine synthetase family protein [Woeseiaceae bacterium]
MPPAQPASPLAELRRYLKRHPDTGLIELLIADVHGILRGKQIKRHEFEKTFEDGFAMPGGTLLLDAQGDVVEGIGWSNEDGDPDLPASVVPGRLSPIPWAKKPSAQAMFRFTGFDGEPFVADPRSVLERAVKRFARRCPRIVMAAELEFFLLDARSDRPAPRATRIPGLGRPQPGPQVYTPDELWQIEDFLNDLHAVCEAQAIPAGTTTAEFAPGQYEINLQHVDDPVLACDHAVLLKRAVKAVALKHDLVACFMAKPFEEHAGSGLHVHMSFYDRNGRNYFSQGKEKAAEPPYSARLRHAIGGLRKTMADATLIFAPNANSYRRLRPEMFAPVEPNWGANHRNVALRVPASNEKNLRFEHRTSGADANPYLVTAAILAGVDHGLRERLDPGPMVRQGQEITLKRKIPNRWSDAIGRFSRSRVLRDFLGEEFCRLYVGNRKVEERRFHNQVSNVDFDWYLRAL